MTPPETPASPATPATSSPNEPSTQDPAASLAEQAHALLNDNTKNWTTSPYEQLNLSLLSPEKQATLEIITQATIQGYTETELATQLGRTPSWVSDLVNGLRRELLAQAAKLRPLNTAERNSLIRSIAAHGVKQPILIAEVTGRATIIDGYHRYLIAQRLQVLNTVPWIYLGTLQPDVAHELAIALNADRRQLNTQEKLELIDATLMTHPEYTDRRIAGICGTSHVTVGSRRRKIAADTATMYDPDHGPDDYTPPLVTVTTPTRIDNRGYKHQAPPTTSRPPLTKTTTTIPTRQEPDELTCPHCGQLVTLHKGQLKPA